MKKPNLKKILKRFTWVDVIIIVCVVGAVVFAFTQIGGNEERTQSFSFDSSTMNKLAEKYLSFYREGKVIKTHFGGYNSSTGEYQEFYGTVQWVDDYKGANVKVLVDVDGQLILAGLYKDVKNADIYIEYITLETDGEKYNNVTEIQVKPENIRNLNDIVKNIPNETNYTIYTTVAIDLKDSLIQQNLTNALQLNGKRESIRPLSDSVQDQLIIIMAQNKELDLASEILGTFNGQTDIITIRIYNSTEKDIQAIENSYDVINIRKVS
ncbi:MAG: adhesin [Methanobrevibacter sp.]|nr:adhesin [Methanobrevibacter sp.]